MYKYLILGLLLFNNLAKGNEDTLSFSPRNFSPHIKEEKISFKDFLIPAGLIATGFYFRDEYIKSGGQWLVRTIFHIDFKDNVDDYLQFVPIGQTFLGNWIWMDMKSKHGYKQLVTNQIVSNLMVTAITFAGKQIFRDLRPDESAYNSFPSGHSATAFNAATMLFLEYRNTSTWYASSGFLFASFTALLRVANNRHWISDVFAGAGVGMTCAIITYYWNPFNFDAQDNKKTSFIGYPMIQPNFLGLGVVYNL